MEAEMIIQSHRGIDKETTQFLESTLDSFQYQLANKFGLEIDLKPDSQNNIYISHEELTKSNPSFKTTMDLLIEYNFPFSSIHFKGKYQNNEFINKFIIELENYEKYFDKFLIFDVNFETAKKLKKRFPKLNLAPSAVHKYDQERFNNLTNGTLYTYEQIKENKELFTYVWLDEWDLTAKSGTKTFYNKQTFNKFRSLGLKIALVTPELHSKKSHKNSNLNDLTAFSSRIKSIIKLKSDIICTDYPSRIKTIYEKKN